MAFKKTHKAPYRKVGLTEGDKVFMTRLMKSLLEAYVAWRQLGVSTAQTYEERDACLSSIDMAKEGIEMVDALDIKELSYVLSADEDFTVRLHYYLANISCYLKWKRDNAK